MLVVVVLPPPTPPVTDADIAAAAAPAVAEDELLELVILGLLSMLAIIEPRRSTGVTDVVLAAALLPVRMILCEDKLNVL